MTQLVPPRSRFDLYWMLGPPLVLLLIFFFYPLVFAVYTSFFDWDLLTEPYFVGFQNYRVLWATGELLGAFLRTLGFSIVVLLGSNGLGLLLALLLNRPNYIANVLRSIVFAAYIVSWVSVALLWLWLLDGSAGAITAAGRLLRLPLEGLLARPTTALGVLAMVTVWKVTGYALVTFSAALQSIPRTHYEAAALDGASAWSRFRFITWPALKPSVAFASITTLILSFQAFDIVRLTTEGGPVHTTTVFVYAIYEHLFLNLRVGYASARVVVFFLLLVLITVGQLRAWSRQERAL
jgi:sn-glycerol 3-phosphate transport system permease protein